MLDISGRDVNVYYSDMGFDFNVYLDADSTANISSGDEDTGITFHKWVPTSDGNWQAVKLVTLEISSGKTYETVQDVLKDKAEKFIVYDITLEQMGVAVQPNGNIKINIPIPENYDTSKLVVYRIADDGTETKYDVTVETIGNKKYASIETDHFSTYVLAEEKATETENENTNTPNTDTPDTDKPNTDTPSTDTPSTDTPSTDTPNTDTPDTDKPSTDTPDTDKPSTDTPNTDTPSTDTPNTDTPSTDTPDNNTNNNQNANDNKDKLDETPKTGSTEYISILSFVALISLVGIAIIKKKC